VVTKPQLTLEMIASMLQKMKFSVSFVFLF